MFRQKVQIISPQTPVIKLINYDDNENNKINYVENQELINLRKIHYTSQFTYSFAISEPLNAQLSTT